jgi:hypothetical protein
MLARWVNELQIALTTVQHEKMWNTVDNNLGEDHVPGFRNDGGVYDETWVVMITSWNGTPRSASLLNITEL